MHQAFLISFPVLLHLALADSHSKFYVVNYFPYIVSVNLSTAEVLLMRLVYYWLPWVSFLNSEIKIRNNIMSLVNSLDEKQSLENLYISMFGGEARQSNLFQVLVQFFITFTRKIRLF